MKFYIILFLFFSASNTFASGYQVYCNSAEGTTQIAHGHVENSLSVTLRDRKNGNTTDKKNEIQFKNISYDFSDEAVIYKESSNSCDNNDEYGNANYKLITSQKLKVTLSDGLLFPKNTVGASEDRKSIEAYLICEENGGGSIICPKK